MFSPQIDIAAFALGAKQSSETADSKNIGANDEPVDENAVTFPEGPMVYEREWLLKFQKVS